MPFIAHSKDSYLLAFHTIYCEGKSTDEAAAATGINATVIDRAATGWTHGRDGRIGRAVFIWWLKGLRSEAGAPCCGAHVVKGSKSPPRLTPPEAELKRLKDLEAIMVQAQSAIDMIRRTWNMERGITSEHETNDPPPDPRQ